ncbi:MAG TPA: preprotein translocase subunit SecE [Candidatus Faeciplasma gallinarum]|uniref:Protein translocase subunit SecE n=1 Tax=Candidatus Faeciplasma gallinarum TaxID=2840799 RepID=A0A9D1ENC8_9FIRM|nr:preprotein translocase subunit SecE [Candidatus Faeciplasma gallinarum]
MKKPNRIVKFFKDLISEVKKVVWPSKKQLLNNSAIVLAVCILSGIALFIVDSVFGLLLNLVVGQ